MVINDVAQSIILPPTRPREAPLSSSKKPWDKLKPGERERKRECERVLVRQRKRLAHHQMQPSRQAESNKKTEAKFSSRNREIAEKASKGKTERRSNRINNWWISPVLSLSLLTFLTTLFRNQSRKWQESGKFNLELFPEWVKRLTYTRRERESRENMSTCVWHI